MQCANVCLFLEGNLHHAFNAGFLTFIVVSGVSFVICANEVNRKYEMIRQAFQLQRQIKHQPPKPVLKESIDPKSNEN